MRREIQWLIFAVCLLNGPVCHGQTTPAHESAEVMSLQQAAEAGDAKAQFALGNNYYYGTGGLPKDRDEGIKWLRKAAEHGDSEMQRGLGFRYRLDGNERETIFWYLRSATQGNFLATSNLFSYCGDGKLSQKECSDVATWLSNFAANDDEQGVQAQCKLGSMFEKGHGVYQSYPGAAQ